MKLSDKAHVYLLFAIVVLATALGSMTQTVMNSMLGGVGATFGIGPDLGQWLTTIYMLVLGITVPVVTFLSHKLSVKNLTYLALGIFLAGAAIAWAAPSFAVLLVGRVLQAIGSGITLPLLQAIAMTRFPPGQNATAMGIAGIAMGFAPNIGPLIGGALVDSWGWRSFFVLLAVALAVLVAATAAFVRPEKAPARPASLDVASLLLSTLGFGALLLGFSQAASQPLASPSVWGSALGGAACLVAFVARQKRIENPLINMEIFASARYRISFVAQNLLFASFMGITLIAPLFVQNLQGGSALEAGIVFIPATIFALIVNPLAGFLADKVGVRPVVVVASAFLAAGGIMMAFLNEASPLWVVTLMQTVRGIGVSALIGPLNSWGMSKLPGSVMMDGSAFFACCRQACASLGTAIMMLMISMGLAAAAAGAFAPEVAYQMAFGLSGALSVAVLAIAIWKVRT